MRIQHLVIISCVLMFLLGCSSGRSPVSPVEKPGVDVASVPVYVSDMHQDGTPSQGSGFLGMYNLHVSGQEISLSSMRQGALTDVLEVVDITNFLKLAPCSDCAKINSVSINNDGNLVASIGIKHPFEAGDPFKPVSGRNRADLHVFNVEGIILSDANGLSYPGLGETLAGINLVNADGFTGYLDDQIDEFYPTNATIHPYILHFDDYTEGNFNAASPTGFDSVVDPPPSGNLVMAMGTDYDYQDYEFNFDSNPEYDLLLAIGCTYAVSAANKAMRFTPEYRVPQHNKKAASEVWVEVTRNDLGGFDVNSDADLEIKVLDINHGIEVGEALNQMKADSSVGAIEIDIPGVLLTSFSASVTPVSGSGRDPVDPLVFAATITNEASCDMGIYSGMVKVTDSYGAGLNESPLLGGMDGIKRVDPLDNPLNGTFAIDEFATYATFTLSVESANTAPVVELLSDCENVYTGGWTLLSVGPGTYDPDGHNLVLYEYDLDYDGITFDIDESNTTGDSVLTAPLVNTTPDPIILTCALRVTDDGVPAASGIGTVDITVHPDDSNGKNIPLRPGENVNAIDLGVNETTGEILVGFDDLQVWKYSPDYSSGAMFFEVDMGCNIVHLDVASNGYSLTRSDIRSTGSGGRSFMYDPSGNRTWGGSQGITYTSGVTSGDGNWTYYGRPMQNRLVLLSNWTVVGDVRWYQMSYDGYNGYGGIFTNNGYTPGTFCSDYTLAFDYRRNPDNMGIGETWILEGAPMYELELFQMPFTYLGTTIGLNGAQSDDLDGFNDPIDMVLDVDDRVYVLDILSTGVNCIKLYDRDGTAIAIFGTCGEIGGTPLAVETDEGDGELHVLHSNGVSVFYPSEIP